MTISTTAIRFEYTGNGATVNFAVGHKFFANSDLKVYQAGTLKTITTHYTVTGAGDEAGGTVTFLVAPTNGQAIIILIDPPITQTMDLVENDPLPAESVEDAFDKVTTVTQRLADRVDRSLVLPDNIEGASITVPAPSARKAILWNATADGLENSTYDPDLAGTYANAAQAAQVAAELAKMNAETAEANAEAAAVVAAALASDAEITALAGLISAANKIPRFTGSGTADLIDFKDEDNMVSDSATAVPSQQSVKAYADNLISGASSATPDTAADYFIFEDATDSTQKKALINTISGAVKQVVYNSTSAVLTGSTVMPMDDTIPQNTEGDQYLTVTFTPISAATTLIILAGIQCSNDTNSDLSAAIFRDTTANALGAAHEYIGSGSKVSTVNVFCTTPSSAASSTTIKLRAGANGAGTTTVNGASAGRYFGGVGYTWILVLEV